MPHRSCENGIFVKNVGSELTKNMLLLTFSPFGPILSCKTKVDDQGKSLGYGLVHFKDAEAAQRAIAEVNGKVVECYGATPLYVGLVASTREPHTKVLFKNLPGGFTAELLKALCAERVLDATITFARVEAMVVNSKARAMGLCAFKTHAEAVAAVAALNKVVVEGHTIIVDFAQSMAKREASLHHSAEPQDLEQGAQASKGLEKGAQANEGLEQGVQVNEGLAPRVPTDARANLFVKNIAASIDDKRLRALFAEFGTITSAKIMLDDNNVSKGFGFVCFSDAQEAAKAQAALNNRVVEGKTLYVAVAQRKEDRQRELSAQAQARVAALGGGFPGGLGFPQMNPQIHAQMMHPQMNPMMMNPQMNPQMHAQMHAQMNPQLPMMQPALFGQRFQPQAFGGPPLQPQPPLQLQGKNDRQRELSAQAQALAHVAAPGGFPGGIGFPIMPPQLPPHLQMMHPVHFGPHFRPQAFGGRPRQQPQQQPQPPQPQPVQQPPQQPQQ
jgi:polyadenylate-binding protein